MSTSAGPLSGRAAQRHRIALLALLALHRERALTREKLVGYLWPETAEERARHLLSDSIYRINSAVGVQAIVAAGEDIRINSGVVDCDVIQFEAACSARDFADAVARYQGPLLDGFFLPDADAFDNWLGAERERLRRLYIGALEAVADTALGAQDAQAAQHALHQLVRADPYSSRASLKLVQTVAMAGDRAAALRLAEQHENLLRDELGLELPTEYREALRRLAQPEPEPARRSPDRSIAVVPFVDLSRARDNEYFTDGITEELIGALARMPKVRVVARSSVFALKGRGLGAREVGSLLNVSWVIEGSVRKDGGQLRIAVQLVDAAEGFERWSATYSRPEADLLAVQEEIASAVVQQIAGALRGAASTEAAVAPEAYDLFLRARYHWHRRKKADLEYALQLFEQVVVRAPLYARGWAGLADAYAIAGFYDLGPAHETFARARAAARRALELDPQLSAVHICLGYVALYFDGDLPQAEATFQHAIALMPDISQAHQYYANLLTVAGRFREAEDELHRAQELDPLSLIASAAHGWALYFARRYELSEQKLQATLERDPDFHPAHCWRAWSLEQLQRHDEMLAELEHAARLSPTGANRSARARGYIIAGQRDRGLAMMHELEQDDQTYVPHHMRTKLHLALGDTAAALRELQLAHEAREYWLVFLGVDPQLDALRGSADFLALTR